MTEDDVTAPAANPNDAIRLDEEPETPEPTKKPDDGVLRFKAVLKEKPVELADSKGKVTCYTLREMNGAEKDAYLAENAKRVQVLPGGGTVVKDFDSVNAMLICRCLWSNTTGKLIDRKAIQTWPSSLQIALFEACLDLNGLNKEAHDREKKD